MRPLILITVLLLSGCAYLPGAIGTTQGVVDKALASNEASLCSGHYPLRAYMKRYGTRWPALMQFCGWSFVPPGLTLK